MRAVRFSSVLALLSLVACADDGADATATASKKLAAQIGMASTLSPDSAVSSPTPGKDPCVKEGWYDDGECDYWCPKGDVNDCAASGGGVACAAFWSPADGRCDVMDPCGPVQDEDCQQGGGSNGGPGTDPGCGEPTPGPRDGKCEPTSWAEFKADPDCADIACPAIYQVPDGVCNAKTACDWVIDGDCQAPDGVACLDIRYATNGKCETPPGCEANDPEDCGGGVACIEIQFPANGKCEAAPGCEYTDSDCTVACDAVQYVTNGRCEAAPGCEGSDPEDCAVACIAIYYEANGKCEAARGCEASDPDC